VNSNHCAICIITCPVVSTCSFLNVLCYWTFQFSRSCTGYHGNTLVNVAWEHHNCHQKAVHPTTDRGGRWKFHNHLNLSASAFRSILCILPQKQSNVGIIEPTHNHVRSPHCTHSKEAILHHSLRSCERCVSHFQHRQTKSIP
jgi:hypothetical protein